MSDSFEVQWLIENVHERFECEICNYYTDIKWNLKRHMKVHYRSTKVAPSETSREGQLICHSCGKIFRSRCGLSQHVRSKHTLQFSFKCGVCSKGFMSSYHYRGHLASHEKILERKCEKCPATFRYQSTLQEHIKVQHQGMEFRCDKDGCAKVFASSRALRDHQRAIHENKYYYCSKCNKNFRWRSSVRYHEKNAHLA